MKAPLPSDELERLAALDRYRVLDTGPEPEFERLTDLASRLLGTPIALVSLIDARRQWFKSHHGLDTTETSRDAAFCAHALSDSQVLVVENATEDERFRDNELVVGPPDIRFYAGAPLRTSDGHNLGTLCVIDRKPRSFDAKSQAILSDLAALAVEALELRLARIRALEQANQHFRDAQQLRLLLEQAPLAVLTMDTQGHVTSWNPAAVRIFGWTPEEAQGKFLPFVPADKQHEFLQLANELVANRTSQVVRRDRVRKDGSKVTLNLAVAPLFEPNGELAGFLSMAEDITERVRFEEERVHQQHLLLEAERAAARVDSLTGLINRRGFEEIAVREIARSSRSGAPLSFVLFDVDHFKQVNDRHGHTVGDNVLRAIGQALGKALRATDAGARWGGEELVAVLPDTDSTGAHKMAERFRAAVETMTVEGVGRVTLSAGVGQWRGGETIKDVLARADQSLYQAKADGRNRVR